jgi:hypothetical protein
MAGILRNLLDQSLDIGGSLTVSDTLDLPVLEQYGLGTQTSTGTGDQLGAPSSGVQLLTDAGATFTAADQGRFLRITGASNGGNNGIFEIVGFTDANNISILNASGVVETSSFTWTMHEPYMLQDDINFSRTDRKDIKGTTNHYDAVPTFQRPSAVGTDVDANLTNLAGKTLDAKAKVRNVKQASIKLRPSITDGDGILAVGDETFTTTNYHFTADDLNSFITISGSTDADGTYRIKTVTAGNSVELDGLNSATAEGTQTWVLEGDLKGILSSRSYADAVDRRGIPIADTGAEDETVYDATFVEVIEPISGGRPSEEDGDEIWARSFGDEVDPNNTATNEGTRFFVQLYTGANNGSATASVLEAISGRSGSTASLAGSNENVSGLTGMSSQDIGRWLTIWNLAADEAGHYQITSIVSATEVTVNRGSNFTADASGAIEWQVSRHPATWDFYNGDRYRLDEIDETADRTTLIGGVQADATLVQDIAEIREFIGAADGDTAPTLTNTGNNFVFSDLSNPADSDLEEIVNTLNAQVGDRTYTGTILTDGETVSESLQALASAVASSSVVRYIERPTSAIPKNTNHATPAAYTPDPTNNGLNMDIHIRGVLKDPGTRVNGDDYEEVDANNVLFFKRVKSGDHINYHIRA